MKEKGINFKVNENFYKEIKLKCLSLDVTLKDYIISLIKKDLKEGDK